MDMHSLARSLIKITEEQQIFIIYKKIKICSLSVSSETIAYTF